MIKTLRFESQLRGGPLCLRLFRLKDLRFLHSHLASESADAIRLRRPGSLLSFAYRVARTFNVIYIVEATETGTAIRIGFAGLYNLNMGRSAWLSLMIFHPEDRRRGYGQCAVGVLTDFLRRKRAAVTLYAEARKTNAPSLAFMEKLGFQICVPGTDAPRSFSKRVDLNETSDPEDQILVLKKDLLRDDPSLCRRHILPLPSRLRFWRE
jgi:RimJ/RimL family protein N-acetyltransferase